MTLLTTATTLSALRRYGPTTAAYLALIINQQQRSAQPFTTTEEVESALRILVEQGVAEVTLPKERKRGDDIAAVYVTKATGHQQVLQRRMEEDGLLPATPREAPFGLTGADVGVVKEEFVARGQAAQAAVDDILHPAKPPIATEAALRLGARVLRTVATAFLAEAPTENDVYMRSATILEALAMRAEPADAEGE